MPTKFLSNNELRNLLRLASPDERLALTRSLIETTSSPLDATELQLEICRAGGHGVANWFRGQGTGYIDMVSDVASGLKIPGMPAYLGGTPFHGQTLWKYDELGIIQTEKRNLEECKRIGLEYTEMAEQKILLKLLEVTYSKLTPEQRLVFDAKVSEVANRFGGSSTKGLAGAAGLLVIGNLGGFATYTLMSTVLSSLSLGALGFGAYTFASSALSIMLGPVGWLALGVAGIHKFGKPQLKKTIPLVAQVAMIRQRVKSERSLLR